MAYLPPPGADPRYPPYQPPPPTNALAIPALITGIVLPPVGIALGHVSLSQIKRREQGGRDLAIAGTVLGYVLTLTVIAVVLVFVIRPSAEEKSSTAASSSSSTPTTSSSTAPSSTAPSSTAATTAPPVKGLQLPPFKPPSGADCTYPPSPEPAAKPVDPPRSGAVPTDPAVVSVSMMMSQGPVGLLLDNAKAPCTVNSFASLAGKGYFDGTSCHRLTSSQSLHVLQCGDPKGDGTGGPGYQFANEYPTNQYAPDDPALESPLIYPRGTLAMANAGPNTNGSQFFIVYNDSLLPPNYTVFGSVDATGLATLDKIAATGTSDGSTDGAPKTGVVIQSVRLD